MKSGGGLADSGVNSSGSLLKDSDVCVRSEWSRASNLVSVAGDLLPNNLGDGQEEGSLEINKDQGYLTTHAPNPLGIEKVLLSPLFSP